MLVPMRILLDHAAENGYGVPAFNINNMEQLQAIMGAASETDSPVIVQVSRGARKYTNDVMLRSMVFAAAEIWPRIPFALHQDHGNSPTTCLSAIMQGFTSVMMDGSLMEDGETPGSYTYNRGVTGWVAGMAHSVGVTVEGELGCMGHLQKGVGEKEAGHGAVKKLPRERLLTDPAQAERFVAETDVDALAVAIGTSHGAYKFDAPPTGEVLAMDVIEEIHRRLPNTHLVMHGSSSVPQELLDIIRKYGGQMKETYGVPIEEIKRGIKHGVRKVNIDTDCRLAMAGAVRQVLAENPKEFDPRKFLGPAREAMQKLCSGRFVDFGAAGKAGKIRPRTCREMVDFYAKK